MEEKSFMLKIRKGYNTVNKSFRLPDELTEKLEKIAAMNNLSLNQLVIQCLDYAVNNIDYSDKKDKDEK